MRTLAHVLSIGVGLTVLLGWQTGCATLPPGSGTGLEWAAWAGETARVGLPRSALVATRAAVPRPQQEPAEAPGTTSARRPRFIKQQWPGLEGYTVLQPNLAYGRQPTTVGLRWLKARGFVGVLDLSQEPDPAEGPLAKQLGLDYAHLPLTVESIVRKDTQERLVEFLSEPRYRPLYVHDDGGQRFAAAWLVFRTRSAGVTVAQVEEELREMGLKPEGPIWEAARRALTQ